MISKDAAVQEIQICLMKASDKLYLAIGASVPEFEQDAIYGRPGGVLSIDEMRVAGVLHDMLKITHLHDLLNEIARTFSQAFNDAGFLAQLDSLIATTQQHCENRFEAICAAYEAEAVRLEQDLGPGEQLNSARQQVAEARAIWEKNFRFTRPRPDSSASPAAEPAGP